MLSTDAQALDQVKAERNLAASDDRGTNTDGIYCTDCERQRPSVELMAQVADAYERKPIGRLFPERVDYIRNGLCTECGDDIGGFTDPLSMDEWKIAGQCQACQDSFYGVAGAITADGPVPSPETPEGWGTEWV